MRNRRNILAELYELGNFQSLTETFTEIAATKMQRVRDSVVKSREYVDGINVIFGDVKTTYDVEIKRLSKSGTQSVRKHNGKTATVFISANTGLYGDIVRRVFYKFVEEVKKSPTDAVVIGKSGKKMVTEEGVKLENVSFFDFPDDAIDFESLKPIMAHLTQYEKVVVYYGKFESIVNQAPTASDITGGTSVSQQQTATNSPQVAASYLIEPTLEEVMTFFENEIITSVFVQTVHESQLAKFASRMLYMDSANQRIKDQIKATEFEKQRLKHLSSNKKQLQTLSSVSLWK